MISCYKRRIFCEKSFPIFRNEKNLMNSDVVKGRLLKLCSGNLLYSGIILKKWSLNLSLK